MATVNTYWKIVKKSLWIPLILAAVLGFWGYLKYSSSPIVYYANSSLVVVNKKPDTKIKTGGDTVDFNGYYSLGTANSFAGTVLDLMISPSTVIEVYKKAGVKIPARKNSEISGLVKYSRQAGSSQVINFSLTSNNKKEAIDLARSFKEVAGDKINNLLKSNLISSDLDFKISNPVIFAQKTNLITTFYAPLIAGLIIGVAFIFLLAAFKENG